MMTMADRVATMQEEAMGVVISASDAVMVARAELGATEAKLSLAKVRRDDAEAKVRRDDAEAKVRRDDAEAKFILAQATKVGAEARSAALNGGIKYAR